MPNLRAGDEPCGSRRAVLAVLASSLALPVLAQQPGGELRIGFQRSASLLVLQKSHGSLEKKLAKLGVAVKWVEFAAGPQLLEGLNAGSIDIGFAGEAPPIFAQAAGAKFYYIGHDPAAPRAEAIVVHKHSRIRSVAQLRGKKVALNTGSNVHYMLVKLLEANGMKLADIKPVYLPPAQARAAFDSRAVDAWAIWDPFTADVQKKSGARIVADATGIASNHQFYLGERSYVESNQHVIRALFEDSVEEGKWLKANVRRAAEQIAPLQDLAVDVVEASLRRYEFKVMPLSPAVIAEQQKIADTFAKLGLVPHRVSVREATWPRRAR